MSTAKKEYYGERVIEAITGFLKYKGFGGKLDPKRKQKTARWPPPQPYSPTQLNALNLANQMS